MLTLDYGKYGCLVECPSEQSWLIRSRVLNILVCVLINIVRVSNAHDSLRHLKKLSGEDKTQVERDMTHVEETHD